MNHWTPIFNPILHYHSLENLLIMTKFLVALLALYVLYYIGNIVYDLFFKKKSTLITEEVDIFSLAEFEEENRADVVTVGIDDVENLNTPKSFTRKEFPIDIEQSGERENIEVWRQKFESEQNIDQFNSESVAGKILDDVSGEDHELDVAEQVDIEGRGDDLEDVLTTIYQVENEDEIEQEEIEFSEEKRVERATQILRDSSRELWFRLWGEAETMIQLVSSENGHKVYNVS